MQRKDREGNEIQCHELVRAIVDRPREATLKLVKQSKKEILEMIRIKGTEWDRATCAEEAARRVQVGDLSEPDNNSLDFALWVIELLKENDRSHIEAAALVEQLRHACSVARGDLLAQGMPSGLSTDRLLQAAVGAAEKYLAPTKTVVPQDQDKVIRDGNAQVHDSPAPNLGPKGADPRLGHTVLKASLAQDDPMSGWKLTEREYCLKCGAEPIQYRDSMSSHTGWIQKVEFRCGWCDHTWESSRVQTEPK